MEDNIVKWRDTYFKVVDKDLSKDVRSCEGCAFDDVVDRIRLARDSGSKCLPQFDDFDGPDCVDNTIIYVELDPLHADIIKVKEMTDDSG